MSSIGGIVIVRFAVREVETRPPAGDQNKGHPTGYAERVQARRGAGAQLVRACLRDLGRPHEAVTRRCPGCGSNEHGRLEAQEASLSVSHASDLTVAAAGPRTSSVGIDVESCSRQADGVAAVLDLDDSAADPLEEWVMREAASKAWGIGVAEPLSRIALNTPAILQENRQASLGGRPPLELIRLHLTSEHVCYLAVRALQDLDIRLAEDDASRATPIQALRTKEMS